MSVTCRDQMFWRGTSPHVISELSTLIFVDTADLGLFGGSEVAVWDMVDDEHDGVRHSESPGESHRTPSKLLRKLDVVVVDPASVNDEVACMGEVHQTRAFLCRHSKVLLTIVEGDRGCFNSDCVGDESQRYEQLLEHHRTNAH